MKCATSLSLAAALFALGGETAAAQGRTRLTFNIYASVPMSDPDYIRKGEAVRIKLMRCGMAVEK